MAKAFARHDFVIKDLAVTVAGGARGGTWLPAEDGKTPPSPISPIASVLANLAHIEAVRGVIIDAAKTQRFEDVAQAFVAGGTGGNAAIRAAIQDIGTAVVASAAFAALGSEVGLINPECGGTSWETIPPTTSPVVHHGYAVHRIAELPRLKKQLAETMAYVDKAAAAQAPRAEEVATVRTELEGALKNLGQKAASV
jgi:hypothetical protein